MIKKVNVTLYVEAANVPRLFEYLGQCPYQEKPLDIKNIQGYKEEVKEAA